LIRQLVQMSTDSVVPLNSADGSTWARISSHLVCVGSVPFPVSVNPVSPAWRLRGRAYAASEASLGGSRARHHRWHQRICGKTHTSTRWIYNRGKRVDCSTHIHSALCLRRLRGKSSHRFELENCRDIAGAPYRYISIMCTDTRSATGVHSFTWWWRPVRIAHISLKDLALYVNRPVLSALCSVHTAFTRTTWRVR